MCMCVCARVVNTSNAYKLPCRQCHLTPFALLILRVLVRQWTVAQSFIWQRAMAELAAHTIFIFQQMTAIYSTLLVLHSLKWAMRAVWQACTGMLFVGIVCAVIMYEKVIARILMPL